MADDFGGNHLGDDGSNKIFEMVDLGGARSSEIIKMGKEMLAKNMEEMAKSLGLNLDKEQGKEEVLKETNKDAKEEEGRE